MSLAIRRLGFHYPGGNWLVRDLDEEFLPGEITAVMGPSGSGKSTLLSILSGDLAPVEGSVTGTTGLTIAKVGQTPWGAPQRSAIDHVVLAMLARGTPRDHATARAEEILDRVGLRARCEARFKELSGGEAQRLALARAQAMDGDVILADEPTAALDPISAATVIDVLHVLVCEGAALVVSSHDPRIAERSDRIIRIGSDRH